MSNILISCAGRRVSLVQFFKTELKKRFPEALVFASDGNPQLSAACQVADAVFVIGKIQEPDYIDSLIKLCQDNDIKLIIPTLDTELIVLATNRERLLHNGIKVMVSNSFFIEKCRNKLLTKEIFNDIGIKYPTIYEKNNVQFPCYVKPIDGSLSKDNYILQTQNDVTEAISKNEKLLYFELINKTDFEEYTVDMYFDKDGMLKCMCPRKRIEIRGGEISKGLATKNYVYDFLLNACKQIDGASGVINMQVFYNSSNHMIYGIEVNPRFGGGYPLSYFAGANFPELIIREYLEGGTINFTDNWKDKTMMLRYDAEIILQQ
jgi:carbamoyl-phosphate synthase large subunit